MAKPQNFHESYRREETVAGSSERGFGLTVGGILAAIGLLVWWLSGRFGTAPIVLCAIGGALVLAALAHPPVLKPLNRAWTLFGLLLFKITNPIVLGLIFFVTVTPIGLLMRLLGKRPLKLKRDPAAASYWIERKPPGPDPETMKHQF